jgi:hypothetical protein
MIFKSAMSVDDDQGAVGVHSLERDTWRNRRRAGELNNLKYDMWVKIQESSRIWLTVASLRFATALLIC